MSPRRWFALLLGLMLALAPACGGEETPRAQPDGTPTPSTSIAEGYVITDERVTKVEAGEEGFIFWIVTFDATWQSSAQPYEALCVWRMYDAGGDVNARGARRIDGPGDDIEIGDAYPDEIPGVPVEASVTCREA